MTDEIPWTHNTAVHETIYLRTNLMFPLSIGLHDSTVVVFEALVPPYTILYDMSLVMTNIAGINMRFYLTKICPLSRQRQWKSSNSYCSDILYCPR